MKHIVFTMFGVTDTGKMKLASTVVQADPPEGLKILSWYACQGIPLPDFPGDKMLSISVIEADSNEAIDALVTMIKGQNGTPVSCVPVLEIAPDTSA